MSRVLRQSRGCARLLSTLQLPSNISRRCAAAKRRRRRDERRPPRFQPRQQTRRVAPRPARSVTGTNREFSAATQALLTPSSGFSSARTTIETVAPGSSEPLDGAASTHAGNEEKAQLDLRIGLVFQNQLDLSHCERERGGDALVPNITLVTGEGTFTEEACAPPLSLTHRIDKDNAQCTGRWSDARNRASPRS